MSDGRQWYPADWVDEACPPSKARPEDFVQVYDEAYQLGYAPGDTAILDEDREVFTATLAIGDIVNFMCCDRFDDVELVIFRDGACQARGPIPPEHNSVMIDGDVDTLHESFVDLVDAIRDPRDDLHAYVFHDGDDRQEITLSFARWSDAIPHQFGIENGKPMFRQVPAAKVSN